MENLTLLEAVLIIVFLVIAGIVVKIGVTFDINAWLKLRSEHRVERLKILCTLKWYPKTGQVVKLLY